jgi:hypothetical protein
MDITSEGLLALIILSGFSNQCRLGFGAVSKWIFKKLMPIVLP